MHKSSNFVLILKTAAIFKLFFFFFQIFIFRFLQLNWRKTDCLASCFIEEHDFQLCSFTAPEKGEKQLCSQTVTKSEKKLLLLNLRQEKAKTNSSQWCDKVLFCKHFIFQTCFNGISCFYSLSITFLCVSFTTIVF